MQELSLYLRYCLFWNVNGA